MATRSDRDPTAVPRQRPLAVWEAFWCCLCGFGGFGAGKKWFGFCLVWVGLFGLVCSVGLFWFGRFC